MSIQDSVKSVLVFMFYTVSFYSRTKPIITVTYRYVK